MTAASEEPTYEFDVAVSFAGEDRELVEGIVARLKDSGIRVFYDTDYQADLWGEDLVEYFDQVYRLKARYTVMFISKFYAEKMWTRHERRSALARALYQRSAYILPVRLDSAELDGLRPTLGYLDMRRMGPDGIVNATLAKLKGTPLAQPVAITRVPRTEGERQQLLLVRPIAWEYLYLAGQLLRERSHTEGKYRDHKLQYARSTGEIVKDEQVADFISLMVNDAQRLSGNITMQVNDKAAVARAVGAPGQPGDPDMIAHLAMRWNSANEEFLDWAARMRGASIRTKYRHLFELLARYSDAPVEQYREFVDKFVEWADTIPADIAAGKPGTLINLQLTISIPDEVKAAFGAEFARLNSSASA